MSNIPYTYFVDPNVQKDSSSGHGFGNVTPREDSAADDVVDGNDRPTEDNPDTGDNGNSTDYEPLYLSYVDQDLFVWSLASMEGNAHEFTYEGTDFTVTAHSGGFDSGYERGDSLVLEDRGMWLDGVYDYIE
jgi:hypothetical protein